jgi:hypothetical protein
MYGEPYKDKDGQFVKIMCTEFIALTCMGRGAKCSNLTPLIFDELIMNIFPLKLYTDGNESLTGNVNIFWQGNGLCVVLDY